MPLFFYLINQGCSDFQRVWILASPVAELFCGVAFCKGSRGFRRCFRPSVSLPGAGRPSKGGGPEFTPQYLSTTCLALSGRGPGDASTPAELLERRTVGKRTVSPNVRLYGRAPRLSSAGAASPAGVSKIAARRPKTCPPGPFFC